MNVRAVATGDSGEINDANDYARQRRRLRRGQHSKGNGVKGEGPRVDPGRTYLDTRPPEVVSNILICLIHQTNYRLDQQIRALEKAFLADGGLRERMTQARLAERAKQNSR
jgi:four helix bundle suffix protein